MTTYNAEISAGSLMFLESKRVASLLLTHPSESAWIDAIEVKNILQKKSPATARRQATLIRKRLMTLDEQGWQLLVSREAEVRNQLLLASAIKHSKLLGDFILQVYALRQRKLENNLSALDWQNFLGECTHRDEAIAKWSDSTKDKLFQVIVRILVEAKYLDNSRSMNLTPQYLHSDVLRYLQKNGERYVIECMERTK